MKMATDYWAAEREKPDMSMFDALGALPSLEESRLIAPRGMSNSSYSRLNTAQEPVVGPGGSDESALGRADVESDEELEAIRGSVRSLRAQRLAVEQLKEKAKADERSAQMLKVRLREAEGRVKELEAQGGKDVVRRLMDEVSELRSRLKVTGAALQTREKSATGLREAMRQMEHDRQAALAQARVQSLKLENQERGMRENEASIRRLEEACARLEEKALTAEKRAEEKCARARREVESLSALLQEAKAALGASKGELEAALGHKTQTFDRARKDKEAFLFERGQTEERIKELTTLCEKQRLKLRGNGDRANELESALKASQDATKVAEKQVDELRADLSKTRKRRKDEDTAATSKLRSIADRAEKLKAELEQARAESEEKSRQLLRHHDEMSSFREDVKKLRDVAAQHGEVRQAIREKDETIKALRERLDLERRERGQWAQARTELLSQFCDEENKLRSTLQTGPDGRHHFRDPIAATDHIHNDRIDIDHVLQPRHHDETDHYNFPQHDPLLRPQSTSTTSDDNAPSRLRRAHAVRHEPASNGATGQDRMGARTVNSSGDEPSGSDNVSRSTHRSYSVTSQSESKSDAFRVDFRGTAGRDRRRRHERSKSHQEPT